MENSTDNYPKSFVPNRPSEFEARFSHFTTGFTDNGEAPIAVLEIDGEDRSLWLWQKALRSRFRWLRPKQGERLLLNSPARRSTAAMGERTGRTQCPRQTGPSR